MSESLHSIRFPGETEAYRQARNDLLHAELELRQKLEDVAAQRGKLPMGGRVKEDYVFAECGRDGVVTETKLSELFAEGKNSLIVYSFMYGPEMKQACPMCTSFLDGADRYAMHVSERVNFVVVAKSPPERLHIYARERGWSRLRLLSSAGNTYNQDYVAENPEGQQIPACNVFRRTSDGIFHFWAAEMLYAPIKGHPRHVDLLWPVWSYFDITPEGRGDFMPRLSYD